MKFILFVYPLRFKKFTVVHITPQDSLAEEKQKKKSKIAAPSISI
jgi:hypothetical protein